MYCHAVCLLLVTMTVWIFMHVNNVATVLYTFYVGAYSGNTRLFLPVLYLCTCFHRIRPHTKAKYLPPGNVCSQVQKSATYNVV